MLKVIATVKRRPDVSRDQLFESWEKVHAPNVAKHAKPDVYRVTFFDGVMGGGEPPYDGMATFSKTQALVDAPDATRLTVHEGAIAFDDIGFHYGRGAGVIENFSLQIAPGEKIGLVGRSGAGKSTLLSLLLRFHDVESGMITIDGQDIAHVTQSSLRANIGMDCSERYSCSAATSTTSLPLPR